MNYLQVYYKGRELQQTNRNFSPNGGLGACARLLP